MTMTANEKIKAGLDRRTGEQPTPLAPRKLSREEMSTAQRMQAGIEEKERAERARKAEIGEPELEKQAWWIAMTPAERTEWLAARKRFSGNRAN